MMHTRRIKGSAAVLATAVSCLVVVPGCGDSGAPPPAASCASGTSQAAVMTALAFATSDAGVSQGFDLDHRVSTAADPVSCFHADFSSPTGAEGIDNQLALLVPVLEAQTNGALDGEIQAAVNSGETLVTFNFTGLDSLVNDECVTLTVQGGQGMPTLGSDGVLNPNQTFDVSSDSPASTVQGSVHNGVFTAGPFELSLPIAVLDAHTVLSIHSTMVQMVFASDGSAQGVLGGGLDVNDITTFASGLNIPSSLQSLVATVVHTISDLDHDDGGCEQFSATINFATRPAFLRMVTGSTSDASAPMDAASDAEPDVSTATDTSAVVDVAVPTDTAASTDAADAAAAPLDAGIDASDVPVG